MVNNKITPAHVLRLYIWELMKDNLDWKPVNDYIPIVPVEDEPMLEGSGKAYIVYGYAENNTESDYEIRRGSISLRIVASSFGEIGSIVSTISRALENEDRSAENVNLWSTSALNGQLRGIRLTTIDSIFVETGEPPEKEGDTIDCIMTISFKYISRQTVILPVDGGLWAGTFEEPQI